MTALQPAPVTVPGDTRPFDAVPERQGRRAIGRGIRHPLTAICAVQAVLSLTLVWSNTAFGDEAHYLWVGRLFLRHWMYGTPAPADIEDRLSGSPVIYPPLGALADRIGGLAGARVLSLLFMVTATVLVYLIASRLIGRRGAIFAASLSAFSEPVLRLAFATYDAMSVLFIVLAAWLAVQAGYRRGRPALIAAAAIALALANATAYSTLVIDPVVVAFAFAAWLGCMRARYAWLSAAGLACGVAAVFIAGLFITGSSEGTGAIFHRTSHDKQPLLLVAGDIWKFSGLLIVLAIIGTTTAILSDNRRRAAVVVVAGCAVLAVPAAQLRYHTGWSLDKHLAYGTWLAAIAAGYGCDRLLQWTPRVSKRVLAACCVVALAIPAIGGWTQAWDQFHSWPDARSFIASITPAAAQGNGLIFAAGQKHIAEYYTPQGNTPGRWSALGMSLNPTNVAPAGWRSYYAGTLATERYSVIALFYNTTFATTGLPEHLLVSAPNRRTYQELLRLVGANSGEPGLPVLIQALEKNPNYRIWRVGPYDTSSLSGTHHYGVFAIWIRQAAAAG